MTKALKGYRNFDSEVSIQRLRFNIWRTINENSQRANNFISGLKLYLMPPLKPPPLFWLAKT